MLNTLELSFTGRLPEEKAGGPDDRLLVQRCAQRDPAALRELVRRYQPKLHRFLRRLLASHEDTEEVALDVFLRVWQQAHRFEGRAAFQTWLYRIAANAAYDKLRQKKGQEPTVPFTDELVSSECSAENSNAEQLALARLERGERAERLDSSLRKMRPEDRLVLVLYYAEELGYAEIQQITSLAYPVLKMRLLRARRRLRLLMDGTAAEVQE